ncbi:MAG: two-component regulator propeller domain-containing protein [Candidatus Manganitrophaceae bacterium]
MKPRFSVILLTVLLTACSKPPPVAILEKDPPPRFVNFETGSNVKSLAFDGEDLWLGLASGLIRYDTRTPDRYETFTVRSTQGLLAKGVYKVAVDREGRKWVGTYGGGLSRYDGKEWLTFTPYGGGRITYDDAWTIYPAGSGLGDLWVYDIYFDSDGTVWVATWKGVSRFDGKQFTTYTEKDGLLDKWVYAIAKDRNGHFWFGTEGGINRFDGKNWIGYTHHDGLGAEVNSLSEGTSYQEGHHGRMTKENRTANSNFVLDIAVDQANNIWVGTWGAGLSRFDGKEWITYTAGSGTIGGNFVHALEVDPDGVLWVGTDHGVTRFDGKRWKTYTVSDGLQDNNVFSIAFDPQGNKWFGTWTGLSKMMK